MKKKAKKTRHSGSLRCDVSGCDKPMYMGWRSPENLAASTINPYKRVCKYHADKHWDEHDNFNLFEVFGVAALGVQRGKFGPIPPDYQEMRDLSTKLAIEESDIKPKIGRNTNKEIEKDKGKFSSVNDDLVDEILGEL